MVYCTCLPKQNSCMLQQHSAMVSAIHLQNTVLCLSTWESQMSLYRNEPLHQLSAGMLCHTSNNLNLDMILVTANAGNVICGLSSKGDVGNNTSGGTTPVQNFNKTSVPATHPPSSNHATRPIESFRMIYVCAFFERKGSTKIAKIVRPFPLPHPSWR